MSKLRALAGVTTTAAIALVGWSCEAHRTALAPTIGGPLFTFNQIQCRPLKMTGGGRIDYPPGTAEKNPPESHKYETFGAHVIGSSQEFVGNTCPADEGSLEWVDHRPEMELNGHPLNLHATAVTFAERSEEHTSELQSLAYLVCRLLLEKKKKNRCDTHRSHCISVIHSR